MRPINFVTRWNVDKRIPVTEVFVNGLKVTQIAPKLDRETFKNSDGSKEASYYEIITDELRNRDKYALLDEEVDAILSFLSTRENFEVFETYSPPSEVSDDSYISVSY